jgi:hypothetical protein
LGTSVAISGGTIVAGAPQAGSGNTHAGAAYVFVKPQGGWANATQTAKLTASDGVSGDQFGNSVAISGDTIVVGAWDAPGGRNQGAAYVFLKPQGGWGSAPLTQVKLTASDAASDNWFGSSVAIDGGTIVVGALGAGSGFQGAAYVFVEPPGGWASGHETAKLTASDGAAADHLGFGGVGVSGGTVVAGAPNGGGNNQGAAYVFVRPPGGWGSGSPAQAKLTTSDGASGDLFGYSVGVSGDTVVAGAPDATVSGQQGQGAAYVFAKPASGWKTGTETARLTASDGAELDQFGKSVAISGDTIVAGALTNRPAGADRRTASG